MANGDADTWFVDTNVLVYANIVQAPLHTVALTRLQQLARCLASTPSPGSPAPIDVENSAGDERCRRRSQKDNRSQ